MNVTQLSVFLENKPGHLRKVLKILADEKINIITLTIAETSDFGIIRMIVNNPDTGYHKLRENNITCTANDVLAIELDDTPGALMAAIDIFSENSLNIEYMYAFTQKRKDKAVMIFRFDNIEAAKKALLEEGFNILKKIDIIGE